MQHPPKSHEKPERNDPLAMLTQLGFGPDTLLMNDPKLFLDGRFLASLMVEFAEELDADNSALALFQIGLLHGLRDAARMSRDHDDTKQSTLSFAGPETTSLIMRWTTGIETDAAGHFSIAGVWPERHEATARCARLGATETPSCQMSAGYTTGWLSGTLDRFVLVREIECAATGAKACRFEAREASAWPTESGSKLDHELTQMPFEAFREIAQRSPTECADGPSESTGDAGDGFDRTQAAVHIWGPVMVLPFTTIDEALGTVEMLSRDAGIDEIRAVVIDLREQALDEGFGAAALEQVLETIESWNAQSLITGISPQSESAIQSLEASHLVLRKDLPEAIATAFQISDAQKHLL